MLLMMAAELVATGAWEMFWFHGLSAGNRFVPRSAPRAVVIGIAMAQLKTKPPTNCILHQQAIRRLSHIGEERATRAGGEGAFGVDRGGPELPTEIGYTIMSHRPPRQFQERQPADNFSSNL